MSFSVILEIVLKNIHSVREIFFCPKLFASGHKFLCFKQEIPARECTLDSEVSGRVDPLNGRNSVVPHCACAVRRDGVLVLLSHGRVLNELIHVHP